MLACGGSIDNLLGSVHDLFVLLCRFFVFVVFNLGLKVSAALLEESPRCLKSTELLAFFTALSYQTPAKLSRERKKNCFYIQLSDIQLFFLFKILNICPRSP